MERSVKVIAPAKINLTLYVTGKRSDGYHDIESVMQSIELADKLDVTLIVCEDPDREIQINLDCKDPHIPCDATNTVYKAAHLFLSHIRGMTVAGSGYACGAAIILKKAIPHQAGLGGGSSDAAAVLKALDHLCGNLLNEKELHSLAAQVGADVPFCLNGGTALCTGIGDRIERLGYIGDMHVLLVKPDFGISTADAYKAIDKGPARERPTDIYKGINEFEEQARKVHPRIDSLLNDLASCCGVKKVGMSGSGTACYALFRDLENAIGAYYLFRGKNRDGSMFVELTKTIPHGIEILNDQ